MTFRTVLVVMLALAVGFLAMLWARPPSTSDTTEKVWVVSVSEDVFNDPLTSEVIYSRQVAADLLSKGNYIPGWPPETKEMSAEEKADVEKKKKDAEELYLNKVPKFGFPAEGIINPKWLSDSVGLSVAPGMQAVSVPVKESLGVARFLRPHDRINIFSSIDSGLRSRGLAKAQLILQDIEVIAVGGETGAKKEDSKPTDPRKLDTIAVQLDHKDAEILETAKANGKITVMKRGKGPPELFTSNDDETDADDGKEPEIKPVRKAFDLPEGDPEGVVKMISEILSRDDKAADLLPHSDSGKLWVWAAPNVLLEIEKILEDFNVAKKPTERPKSLFVYTLRRNVRGRFDILNPSIAAAPKSKDEGSSPDAVGTSSGETVPPKSDAEKPETP